MADDKQLSIKIRLSDKITKPLKKVGKGLGGLASKVLKSINPFIAITAAAAGFGAAIIKLVGGIAGLQTKMVNVGNLTGASREEVNRMTDDLVKLSTTLPQSVDNLAESLFDVVSAGVPAGESIKFLETAGKLATAGVTDTKTAVDGLTSVLNAFSMDASEAEAVSDKFFAAQQKGKTTIAELSSSIGQVAPIAAGMGVSFDELIASMSTLTLSGIKTSEATTGLRATLSNLLKPSEQAAKVAAELGIEFDANAVQSKGLSGVLSDVIDKTGGSKVAMGQLFGSMEAVNTVLALSNENFQALEEVQDAVTKSSGATKKAFDQTTDTLDAQWKMAKNNLFALGETLLGWLIPVLTKTLKYFNDLFKGIQKGFEGARKVSKWFTGLFKKDIEQTTDTLEKETEKQTDKRHDEELEQLKNYQDQQKAEVDALLQANKQKEDEQKRAKAAEVENILATMAEREKLRKEEARKKKAEQEKAAEEDARLAKEKKKKEAKLQNERIDFFKDVSNQILQNEGDFVKVIGNMIKKMLKDELNAMIAMEQAKLAVIAAVNWWNPLGWEAGAKIAGIEVLKQAGFAAIDAVKFADGGVVKGSMVGDKNLVRANGGEVISNSMEQANLLHHMSKNRGATLPPAAGGSGSTMGNQHIELHVDGKKLAETVVNTYNRASNLKLISKLRV